MAKMIFKFLIGILLISNIYSHSYNVEIITSNKTFESINGQFSLILDAFELKSKIDENFNYSNLIEFESNKNITYHIETNDLLKPSSKLKFSWNLVWPYNIKYLFISPSIIIDHISVTFNIYKNFILKIKYCTNHTNPIPSKVLTNFTTQFCLLK